MIDLAEIRAALAAATPGPWRYEISGHRPNFDTPIISGAGPFDRVASCGWGDKVANAHLISNAPAWLAALCDEVERPRNYDREMTTCSGALPKIRQRSEIEDCGQDGVCALSPGCNRHWEERNRELVRELEETRAFLRRTAMAGGSIVSSVSMTPKQIAIARATDRMFVAPDGYGFVYVPGPRFCACGRIESDCDQSRASCSKADTASEDEESDIVVAGRQVPFVQVGMIVHPDDCLNCERDGNPLWCSALVCDIRDDDETARFGMMATLLFRNGERREEPCGELRRHWRLARDFDQARVYTGRWGAIPRGSVWPVAEVCEEA